MNQYGNLNQFTLVSRIREVVIGPAPSALDVLRRVGLRDVRNAAAFVAAHGSNESRTLLSSVLDKNKIAGIKMIRRMSPNLGLKDAKELVELFIAAYEEGGSEGFDSLISELNSLIPETHSAR